jgi:hypothetical protein
MKRNYLILLELTIPLFINAQESLPATGGNAKDSSGSVSYTVGQLVYTTNSNTKGIVAQGIQQPYDIIVVTGIAEAKEINLECSVFPNPTNNYLTLKVVNGKFENLSFQIYDMKGTLLQNKRMEGNETSISMGNLIPSTYIFKVTDNAREIKTFKIIKK